MLPPTGETERDDGREQHQFIRQRVQDGAQAAGLVEVTSDEAIHRVTDRGEGEGRDGPPAQGFIWQTGGHALAIIHGEPDEDGNEQDAKNSDLGGKGHAWS